jgi:hypothetical protein
MGVGDGSNTVGVKEGEAGLVVTSDGCVAMSVGEGSIVSKTCGEHALQSTRTERKRRDFIFALI